MITRIYEFLQGDYFNEVKEVILTEFVGLCIFKDVGNRCLESLFFCKESLGNKPSLVL